MPEAPNKIIGPQHIDTIIAGLNLGVIYYQNKNYQNTIDVLKPIVDQFIEYFNTNQTSSEVMLARYPTLRILGTAFYYIKDYEQAFYYLELTRSGLMLNDLAFNVFMANKDIDQNIMKKLNILYDNLDTIERTIDDLYLMGSEPDLIRESELELASHKEQFTQIIQEVCRTNERYKRLMDNKSATYQTIKSLLKDNQIVVKYIIGINDSYQDPLNPSIIFPSFVITISNKEINFITLEQASYYQNAFSYIKLLNPASKKIPFYTDGINVYYENNLSSSISAKLKKIDRNQGLKNVNDFFYSKLIKPVIDYTGNAELYILPDGPLMFMPIDALKNSKGQYLMNTIKYQFYPSASIMLYEKTLPVSKASNKILCLGGIRYTAPGDIPIVNTTLDTSDTNVSKKPTPDFKWLYLEDSKKEVNFIAGVLSAEVLEDREASEPAVKEMSQTGKLSQFRWIHFSTHGYFNVARPEASCLVLAMPEKYSTLYKKSVYSDSNDGYLTLSEIMRLQMDCDLVMLSACQLGGQDTEQETLGLLNSFFKAGTRGIIASTGNLNEESSMEFAKIFYSKLKDSFSDINYRDILVWTKQQLSKSHAYSGETCQGFRSMPAT